MNKSKIKCFLQVNACVSQGVNFKLYKFKQIELERTFAIWKKHG